VADGDLVVSLSGKNGSSVVKNIKSEVLAREILMVVEFSPIFQEFDVHSGCCMVSWTNYQLFFEYNPILGWHVGVHILTRFTLDNLVQVERVFVAESIDHELAFIRVVGHCTLDDQKVSSSSVGWQVKVAQA